MRPILLATLLAAATAPAGAGAPIKVVELYQSQGCSSCPPAITNANRVANRSDLLVLDFAVTYWDRLGWKDSFAQPAFTARQWAYARGGGRPRVHTPQVIVNGRSAGVGGSPQSFAALIAAERPLGGPALTFGPGSLSVAGGRGRGDVWLVRYDPRALPVAIRAGENGGRTIVHRNIVRQLVRLGDWTGAPRRFPVPAGEPGLATAVLIQEKDGGPILAAARGG
ncbi:DUF1223 domain-containing protein [Sphingomonas sp. 1P06PA]|uniref:DUF1223 domain-containing protein n=1 Tax=Sphingomonas sp. 1P06PA TaxID=554121 RepID=UPI0039A4B92E